MTAQPIASNLFETSGNAVHLIAGRRKSDGRVVFPMPSGTAANQYEPVRLGSEGTLWSYTVQRFRPKSPPYGGMEDERSFKPFALGYVELPGQVIVETRIEVDDPAKLRIGMKMQAGTQVFARAEGGQALTFVFRPAA